MILAPFEWPLSRLDEAIESVARYTGHSGGTPGAARSLIGSAVNDPHALGRAIERLLSAHGLEVEPCVVRYRELERLPAPLVLRVPDGNKPISEPSFLVIVRRERDRMTMIGVDGRMQRVSSREVAAILRAPLEATQRSEIEQLLEVATVAEARRPRVRRALLDDQLADSQVTDAWQIVNEPGGDFLAQLRRAGIGRAMAALVALHATQFALWIAAWWLVGRGALDGRTDWGWLTAWALLLATVVPLQLWSTWLQGDVALRGGRLLKERLLAGALRLDPEDIRHEGAGRLLGRVLESDAVESLAVGGGLQAGLAAIEIVMAAGVLWFGATGGAHVALLIAVSLGGSAAAVAYYHRRQRWTEWRLAMTHDLVERVAGHRTRLSQEARPRWHEEEDRALEEYVVRSAAFDKWLPWLLVVVPRGWIVMAVAILAPAFVTGTSTERLAISIGGVLLASLALRRFADGLSQLSGAAIAWRQARPLFEAATRRPAAPAIAEPAPDRPIAAATVLEVRDVSYRYPSRQEPVLRGCTLRAAEGDRLLLQGRSGGGKSTLASIIAGLRIQDSGLVLVNGLDRRTVGAHGWRRRVVAAPQFHENHVFSETFAFNLLMGRRWPPTDDDLLDAEAIVRELGLADLVTRMPAGVLQVVGESGWQLSHGERSRLFMARALLQGGEVMILDESFAALDPENLRETLECVLKRARTLIVIAHP